MGSSRLTVRQAVVAIALLVVVALVLLWLIWPLPKPAPSGRQVGDVYYSGDRKIPVTISLDEIGVIAADDASEARLTDVATSLGGRLRQIDREIYLVELGKTQSRRQIDELAGKLRRGYREVISEAGLVVRDGPAERPVIVTDELLARVGPGGAASFRKGLRADGLEPVEENPYVRGEILLRVLPDAGSDALEAANRLRRERSVVSAMPNFAGVIEYRDDDAMPQWYIETAGDADIDATEAWDITRGSDETTIAVIDLGTDDTHPDLRITGGKNFADCSGSACADPSNPQDDGHGTAVAGLAAARGMRLTGVCPGCKILPIRIPNELLRAKEAFGYAVDEGADVVVASWGAKQSYFCDGEPGDLCHVISDGASEGRGGKGTIFVMAMSNTGTDDCDGSNPDLSSQERVIAVSASTDDDDFPEETYEVAEEGHGYTGFGTCMDLLAPGDIKARMPSTDITGDHGYNHEEGAPECNKDEPDDAPDYTRCFGGTSAAAPLVAGAAALLVSEDSDLKALQVQRLLQDTADKIAPGRTRYKYGTGNGRGKKRGFGRLNVFEAVRLASSGGRDLFIRDNALDWGNTARPSSDRLNPHRDSIPHWDSPDIKVVSTSHSAPETSAEFDALPDDPALEGERAKVHVRVRNRGPNVVRNAIVRLYWTPATAGHPPLTVADAPSGTPAQGWRSVGSQALRSVPYSGASAAYSADWPNAKASDDDARIVTFALTPSDLEQASHASLLATVSAPADRLSETSSGPLVPDRLTPRDSNAAQHNVLRLPVPSSRRKTLRFFVSNPFDQQTTAELRLESPDDWNVDLTPGEYDFGETFDLEPLAHQLVTVTVEMPSGVTDGDVRVYQDTAVPDDGDDATGGVVYAFGSP